jgi:hypothetical protein
MQQWRKDIKRIYNTQEPIVTYSKLKEFVEVKAEGKLIYWKLEGSVAKRYLKSNDMLLEEFDLY